MANPTLQTDFLTEALPTGVFTTSTDGLSVPVYNAHTTGLPFTFVSIDPTTNQALRKNNQGVVPVSDGVMPISGVLMRPTGHDDRTLRYNDDSVVNWNDANGDLWLPEQQAGTMAISGFMNFEFEQNANPGDPLFLRFAVGSNPNIGYLRIDDDGGSARDLRAAVVTAELQRPVSAGQRGELFIRTSS